jgi:hypothetical protein
MTFEKISFIIISQGTSKFRGPEASIYQNEFVKRKEDGIRMKTTISRPWDRKVVWMCHL